MKANMIGKLNSRRALLVSALGAAASTQAQTTANAPPIAPGRPVKWGLLGDLKSAVSGRPGADLLFGTRLALQEVNARGGMFGRRIDVEPLDTGGDPAKTASLLTSAKEQDELFGLISTYGTAETVAAIRTLQGWPIFGATTGADPVRRAAPPNVVFMRASWGAELDRLMAVAKSVGFSRIGIVYPEGPTAQAAQGLIESLTKKHGITVGAVATIPHPASLDVAPAAAKLARSDVQLVVVALSPPAADFMLEARRAGLLAPMYTLSDAVGPEFVSKLKDRIRGIGFCSPIPSPWDSSMPIVRDYQQEMTRAKRRADDYTFPSLEGYLNGRLLIETLKRVGPDLSRARFIDASRALRIADFGGLSVDLTRGNTALSYTDVFVLTASGRVMR
jgi:branched-chain amino acid transport system substrate-binding protein